MQFGYLGVPFPELDDQCRNWNGAEMGSKIYIYIYTCKYIYIQVFFFQCIDRKCKSRTNVSWIKNWIMHPIVWKRHLHHCVSISSLYLHLYLSPFMSWHVCFDCLPTSLLHAIPSWLGRCQTLPFSGQLWVLPWYYMLPSKCFWSYPLKDCVDNFHNWGVTN
jgi:hypothetical protein